MEDRALVQQCVEGNRGAQHELFTTYRHKVLGLVWRTLGPRSDGELDDAIQQVFIQVFRSLTKFRWEASLETWVHRICIRVCMSLLRTRYRRRKHEPESDPRVILENAADAGPDPLERMQNTELASFIYAALDRIDPRRRVVFVLAEIDGQNLETIAEMLKCPVGTVKSRLFRARKDLARILGHLAV